MKRAMAPALLTALLLPACSTARRVIVTDAATGRPVPGARVTAAAPSFNGAEAPTDAAGEARVAISPLMEFIIVSKAGYESAQADLPDKWPLRVRLKAGPEPDAYEGDADPFAPEASRSGTR